MSETIKKILIECEIVAAIIKVDVCMDLHMYIWIYMSRFDRKS